MRRRATGCYLGPVTLWLLAACAGWPRYAHLPEDTGTPLAPGDSGGGDPVDWTAADYPTEPRNDSPALDDAQPITVGDAVIAHSNFESTGWAAVAPERATCTGDTSESDFPVWNTGSYTGDIDWWVLDVQEGGVLCSRFASYNEAMHADVLLYTLSGDCGLPTGPVSDDHGVPLGYAPSSGENDWNTVVEPGVYALVAAGYQPNDDQSQLYTWGLAVLAPSDEPACPGLPR